MAPPNQLIFSFLLFASAYMVQERISGAPRKTVAGRAAREALPSEAAVKASFSAGDNPAIYRPVVST